MSTHVTIILQNIDWYHNDTISLESDPERHCSLWRPLLDQICMQQVQTDPMQCFESLDSVCEDLHRILSHHVIRILQNRICNTFRSRRPCLVTPVGPDISALAVSPDRSHAVPWNLKAWNLYKKTCTGKCHPLWQEYCKSVTGTRVTLSDSGSNCSTWWPLLDKICMQ